MKVFNKSARLFRFHGVDISSDKFTDLTAVIGDDPIRKAQAEKLLVDYPNELLAGETASADVKTITAASAAKDKEIATLKGQVEKLQKLLLASESPDELKARAEDAEAQLEAAREKIATLERQINAALAASAETPAPESPASDVPTSKKKR